MYEWRAVITTHVYAPRVIDVLVKLSYGGKGTEENSGQPCNYEWGVGFHPKEGLAYLSVSEQ